MSGLLDSLGFGPRAPRELAFRAEPLWIGDAAAARRLMAGTFRFAGQEVQAKALGPWRISPPSRAFADALHGFSWLDDLAALGTREARRIAQSWVFGWIAQHGEGQGGEAAGWSPEVAGQRAMHWLERAEFVLDGASDDLTRRFLKSLAVHAKRLRKGLDQAPEGLARLRAATGLLHAVLATDASDAGRAAAARRLGAAAGLAVDADGGLASRNPERLCEALILLAVCARRLREAGIEPERAHSDAVFRAQSALRALRMRDGGLPRFHGGGPGAPGRLDHALSLAHPRKAPPPRDRAMGFVRLAAGRVTVAIDAAAPPPGRHAHASTLAFEMAVGGGRLVVNCGPAEQAEGDWAAACRATAAQSALSIEGVSSSRISSSARGPGPHPFVEGPKSVEAETTQDLDGAWFLGVHDGYAASHGLSHRRRLFLSPDGRDFRGEDLLEPPDPKAAARLAKVLRNHGAAGLPFALHFHLHPDVEAELDGEVVILTLPESRWRFVVTGAAPVLRDSVFFEAGEPEPRAARQIAVPARATGEAARVAWGFQRL
ncbi:heparinase II/III family protein [Albimonas sp. CAU 1670]|uniref:heparinase II/III family protein n=1 Tax=Albimonas sp. CAU 1670 TaxID=3032599 RepID=UPI0023DC17BB|nr:heparinase II/III family protein [Albimonas sp. CAU 1670]MDF2231351.1 heparinase II/III family protein [Albimonas sp. CAU 1670]